MRKINFTCFPDEHDPINSQVKQCLDEFNKDEIINICDNLDAIRISLISSLQLRDFFKKNFGNDNEL